MHDTVGVAHSNIWEIAMKVMFLVLSGGKGTRLRPATFFSQKTLLPAMNNRKILDYAIESGDVRGISGVEGTTVVLARYKSRQVAHYVREKYPNVSVLVELAALDTGGAVLQHWQTVCDYAPDVIIVLNGDHLVRLPVQDLLRYYVERNAPALLMVGIYSDEAHHDYIDVQLNSEKVLHKFFHRKSRVAYTGIPMFRFDALNECIDQLSIGGAYNMTKDIVEWVYAKYGGECYILRNEWDDLGTWKRYLGFLFREFRTSG
jgi:glucose-1-phosphate thymidylyltransferase